MGARPFEMSLMMNKNAEFMKAVTLLAILMAAGVPPICSADSVTKSADPGIALQNDAPVYTGPVQEGDLEELTMRDFQGFGIESERPEDQYRQYQKFLEQPVSGILVPYKMRIVDRDLALEDFLGFDVPEDLSEARYEKYLNMTPVTVDGRTIHYVYIYHSPLARAESGTSAS